MIVTVFSIFDEKAETYSPPFFMPQIGQGIRWFSDLVKDPSTHISKHPSDYKLYKIGEFNDVTSEIVSCNPVFLSNGIEHVKKGYEDAGKA